MPFGKGEQSEKCRRDVINIGAFRPRKIQDRGQAPEIENAIMDIRLIAANPAELETECLVVFALDHETNAKPEPRLAIKDPAIEKAAAGLLASGEITGKAFETALLHNPPGLKAKRLLVAGCGKAKTFSHTELRKAAGTALRALKPKMIKLSLQPLPSFCLPEGPVCSIVEGAYVA